MWKWMIMTIPLVTAGLELIHGMLGRGHVLIIFALFGINIIGMSFESCFKNDWHKLGASAIISFLCSVLVYYLAHVLAWGPITASGAVGLLASRILKDKGSLAAYTGVFVGMTSAAVIADVWLVGLAGLLAGMLYETMEGVWEGIGGRLGTIAAAAVILTILLSGRGW